jgi:hypothetical protein
MRDRKYGFSVTLTHFWFHHINMSAYGNPLFTSATPFSLCMPEYLQNLADVQGDHIPVEALTLPIDGLFSINQTAVYRCPGWNRLLDIWRYESGGVPAPYEKDVSRYGAIASEKIWNVNPLAGTGSDNVDFMAKQGAALIG